MKSELESLDIQHLRTLGLLLQECSVTRVAHRSGQTQPTVSRMLRRLRDALGDPLLVRSGAHMVLTERGHLLREPLQEILSQLTRITAQSDFAPAQAAHTFQIACTDCLPPLFLPRLVAQVLRAGPRLKLRVQTLDAVADAAYGLEDGSLDLVINNSPNPRGDLRTSALFADEIVCLMRADHPAARAGRLRLGAYLALDHLAPHSNVKREHGPIDGELARIGYRRRIAATVPEFNQVPFVLQQTDLVFTTGRSFADHYVRSMGLIAVPAPAELPAMHFYQLWHERSHGSASNRWLRALVAQAFAAQTGASVTA
jgi:DNA-binding transcriptional LysR family regulator